MKYNINVIKSVWRRLRKPSRATLDAICSKDAVYSEVLSKNGHFLRETETPLQSKDFPRLPVGFQSVNPADHMRPPPENQEIKGLSAGR